MKLAVGKLDSDLLKEIVFGKITYRNEDVKVRPGIGEDCALIDFGDYDCVMSTDPISSTVSDIGRLAIHITCNDIASNGIQPLGIMLACMLPEGTTDDDVKEIMEQAGTTAAEVGVEIIGGHTEITPSVKQPLIVSTAIGKAPAGTSQNGNDMIPGDFIMMTKAVGLEGTGIIACDHEEEIRAALNEDGSRLVTDEEIEKAKSFLNLVSVVPEGVATLPVGAFQTPRYLTQLTIPPSVTTIENGAIDKLTISSLGRRIRYRVRPIGASDYLSWMENKIDMGGSSDTFAGIEGKEIDRIQIVIKK